MDERVTGFISGECTVENIQEFVSNYRKWG